MRASSDAPGLYTFWDYQAGAWQKNWGIRIDHLLLSPQAADRLRACGIDKHVRGWEKPSDHVPVWAEFALQRNLFRRRLHASRWRDKAVPIPSFARAVEHDGKLIAFNVYRVFAIAEWAEFALR